MRVDVHQVVDESPVSQMSAAALPAGTEQLALVAALAQRPYHARALRFWMAAVLLEHQGEVLSDEFRARNPTLARSPRQQPIVFRIGAMVVRRASRQGGASEEERPLDTSVVFVVSRRRIERPRPPENQHLADAVDHGRICSRSELVAERATGVTVVGADAHLDQLVRGEGAFGFFD